MAPGPKLGRLTGHQRPQRANGVEGRRVVRVGGGGHVQLGHVPGAGDVGRRQVGRRVQVAGAERGGKLAQLPGETGTRGGRGLLGGQLFGRRRRRRRAEVEGGRLGLEPGLHLAEGRDERKEGSGARVGLEVRDGGQGRLVGVGRGQGRIGRAELVQVRVQLSQLRRQVARRARGGSRGGGLQLVDDGAELVGRVGLVAPVHDALLESGQIRLRRGQRRAGHVRISLVQPAHVGDRGLDPRQRGVAQLDVDVRARRLREALRHRGQLDRGLHDVRNLALARRVDDAADRLDVRQRGDLLLELPDAGQLRGIGQIPARHLDQHVERHQLALGQVLAQRIEPEARLGAARQLLQDVEVLLELGQREERRRQRDQDDRGQQPRAVRDPPGHRRPETLVVRAGESWSARGAARRAAGRRSPAATA